MKPEGHRRSAHFRPSGHLTNWKATLYLPNQLGENLLTGVACPTVSNRFEGTLFLSVGDFELDKIWDTSFTVCVIDAALVQGAEIVSCF